MHLKLIACLLSAVAFGFVLSASAAPADLAVSAYKEWQQRAKQEIEEEIKKDFAEREADMETLAAPFQIGEEVEIVLRQGNRVRKIRGKFKDIEGTEAEIGEAKYLIRDIRPVDADRLRFGKHPQLLQLKLDQMRQELELERSKIRGVRLDQKSRLAGYTDEFFDTTIELGGRYWYYRDLGENQIEVIAREVADEPFIELAVINRTDTESATLVILGKSPVASTIKTSPEQLPEFSQQSWSQLRFRISRDDLGDDPWKTIEQQLKLWIVKDGTGSWQFTMKSANARGEGARFRTQLPRLRIKPHTPVNLRNIRKYSQAAAAYQASIEKALVEKRAAMVAAEKAQREQELATEAELERLRESREAAIASRKAAEEPFVWLSVEDAKKLNAGARLDARVLTDDTYDNINYPTTTTIDDQEYHVLKFTEWEKRKAKTPPRDPLALYEVISVRYRILRLMHQDVYKRKMKVLEEKNALPDKPEVTATIEYDEVSPEFFDEYDAPPGYRRGPTPNRARPPRGQPEIAPESDEKTLVQLLEEIDENDQNDIRPDPGYLLQYRIQYQNRLSKATEFITAITATNSTGEIAWEDAYSAESQYLGPLYGSYKMNLEEFAKGIDSLAIEIKIEGAEEERKRLQKEREKQIEMAKQNKLIKALPTTEGKAPGDEYDEGPSLFD